MRKHLYSIICACALFLTSCVMPNIPEEFTPQANHSSQPVLPVRSAKRGVSFDFKNTEDAFLLREASSWSYNWGPNEDSVMARTLDICKMEFIPMAWTKNFSEERIRAWKKAHPTCEYILGFNEPNLKDQCNMTPREVADEWPRLQALAKELNMKLVSPAMNYGTLDGYSDPVKWLDEFFTYIPLEKSGIEVIAIHCYMNTASAVKGYVERFYKYGKPIWMTEFCAWDGGVNGIEGQMDYMADVISFFELNPHIERYAWFMPRMSGAVETMPYNQLLTHGVPAELTSLGVQFHALPNLAQPALQAAELPISLNLYTSNRQSEYIEKEGICSAPHFRATTDGEAPEGTLMIDNMMQDGWVEYNVEAIEDLSLLNIRYQSTGEPILALSVDGSKDWLCILPTSAGWMTRTVNYPLAKGRHTVRVKMFQGFANLSTIYWSNNE